MSRFSFGLFRVFPAFVVLMGCATVPVTGRRQLLLLSQDQETALGLQSYQEVLSKEKLSTDPAANALVQQVGARIASATGKDFAWEFKVVDKPETVNAFCLPGGKVVVYSGILPVTQDANGLATVLGHEIAHAIARHGGERVSEGLLTNVGIEAVTAAVGVKDPQTLQTVTGLLGAGATVGVMLPFSREQESEADHLGLIYMAKAGFPPDNAVTFWQRMMAASPGAPPQILSDHPSDETRIKQIQDWLPEAQAAYVPGPAITVAPPAPAAPAPAPPPAPAPAAAPPPPPPTPPASAPPPPPPPPPRR
jgi:predicted Zn-dependent protease